MRVEAGQVIGRVGNRPGSDYPTSERAMEYQYSFSDVDDFGTYDFRGWEVSYTFGGYVIEFYFENGIDNPLEIICYRPDYNL